MRILLLSNLYPPYVEGGAEILAGDIASSLERLGHEVFVLTSSYGLVQPHRDGNIYRTLQLIPPAHFDRRRLTPGNYAALSRKYNPIFSISGKSPASG